jgi:vacuolar-type H+-ATPase subunit H
MKDIEITQARGQVSTRLRHATEERVKAYERARELFHEADQEFIAEGDAAWQEYDEKVTETAGEKYAEGLHQGHYDAMVGSFQWCPTCEGALTMLGHKLDCDIAGHQEGGRLDKYYAVFSKKDLRVLLGLITSELKDTPPSALSSREEQVLARLRLRTEE